MEVTEIKVIIYEDNPDMREGLAALVAITPGFILAGAYADCYDAATHVQLYAPDVILMDIEMPGMNGITGIKNIREVSTEARIIVLTVFEDNKNVFDAICAGANGYLLKKSTPQQIIDAVMEVLKGGAPMSSSIASKVLKLLAEPGLNRQQQTDYGLTEREKQILQSLVKGNSYKMIAAEENITIDTVKTHLKKVYQKLQVHSQTEAVIKALNQRIV